MRLRYSSLIASRVNQSKRLLSDIGFIPVFNVLKSAKALFNKRPNYCFFACATVFFLFASCSNEHPFSESEPHISIAASFFRNSDSLQIERSVDTIAAGEKITFVADIKPSPSVMKSYFWTISDETNAKKYPFLKFSHSFDASGFYPVKFYAVDNFGDTSTTDMFIQVSKNPICKSMNLSFIQDTIPVFEWDCQDPDIGENSQLETFGEKLYYSFKLKNNKAKILLDTTLLNSSLQLPFSLPADYWEAHLTAKDTYGLKAELDTIYKLDGGAEE